VMKIAFILGCFPVVSETFIIRQITGLIDLGHKVDIYALSKGDGIVHPEIKEYDLLTRTQYFNIPQNKVHRALKLVPYVIESIFRKPKVILEAKNTWRDYHSTILKFYMLKPFLTHKYDVIHCHFGPTGKIFLFLKAIFPKSRYVVTFYGYDFSAWVKACGMNIYKNLFEKSDCVIAVSDYMAHRLLKLRCPSSKVVRLYIGLDLQDFPYRDRTLKSDETIKLLTVARLVEKKGLEYSIKAVAQLAKKYPRLIYKIVGEGPLRSQLENLIRELGVKDKVFLLGAQNSVIVRQLIDEAHLFVLASITAKDGDQEGLPVVLQEAQAQGLPVVATLHDGLPESVLNGKSGFLVPERDVNALTEKLEYLIEHPEIWPEMGHEGRKLVETHFDIKKLSIQLVRIYEKLLKTIDPTSF